MEANYTENRFTNIEVIALLGLCALVGYLYGGRYERT